MNAASIELSKAVLGVVGAGLTWVGDIAASNITAIPEWIADLGFPGAFICCVVYALVATHKSLKESVTGRLADKDEYLKAMRQDQEKQADLQQRYIEASISQRVAFEKQAEAFDRLCTKIEH